MKEQMSNNMRLLQPLATHSQLGSHSVVQVLGRQQPRLTHPQRKNLQSNTKEHLPLLGNYTNLNVEEYIARFISLFFLTDKRENARRRGGQLQPRKGTTHRPQKSLWRLLAHHKSFPLWHKVLIILAKNIKFTNSIVYFNQQTRK